MPKVYIPNDSGQDFKSAEAFGELVPMTTGTQNRWNMRGCYHTFFEKLQDSEPDDYLMLVGMATQIAIATGILARRHGVVNYLIFDPKHSSYQDCRITFSEVMSEEVTSETT